MKKMRKIAALLLAMVMVLGMSVSVFAASIEIESTADDAASETTEYTYYKILDATIEDDTKITVDPATGASTAAAEGENAPKVVYYVTTQAKATALEGLKIGEGESAKPIFNVTKDATQNKWYVELNKETNATAAQIAEALDGVKTTFSDVSGTFAQTTPGGKAKKDGLDPGYYLITSTLGDKLAVQTLADITIQTKNSYPGVEKAIDPTDVNAQIGDEINYTLTVEVPESANDQIVLTDTMDAGLTFKSIDSVKSNADGNPDVAYTLNPAVPAAADKTFTITFTAETVIANKGKTITIIYTAILNEDAAIETDIPNTLKLKYGNRYESVVKSVETKTYKFEFDKVDGTDKVTKLVGAEFELQIDGTALDLIEVEAGKTYRIATGEEIDDDDVETTKKIVTNGNTITINGLDSDVTYILKETKAPTGYNIVNDTIEVKAKTTTEGEGEDAVTTIAFEKISVENNKGTVLPSTGGIGTTIFYIVGAILVIGAGVLLVTRRRMNLQ